MERRCFLKGLGLITLGGLQVELPAAETCRVVWHQEIQSAWKTMQSEQRPMLLFLTMDGCYHCRRMKTGTYEDSRVLSRICRSYVAASIDGTRTPELARKLNIRVYPTTVIISPDARVLDSMRGYIGPDDMQARLATVSERYVAAR